MPADPGRCGELVFGLGERAIERRQVRNAEMAARELGRLSLADALALVALYAIADDAKLEQAAVKYLGRLSQEQAGLTLSELQLAASALAELGGRRHDAALNVLQRML